MKMQDAKPEYMQYSEHDPAATPEAGVVRIYAKTDGLLYSKNDEGTEVCLGSAASLTTKGDLFCYGASATRLPVGANGTILQALSTEDTGLKWVADRRGIAFNLMGIQSASTSVHQERIIAPCALKILSVLLAISVAPTGADLIVDIHKNGVTVFTTQENRPTIAAGATTGTSVAPDITAIAEGDLIEFFVDQVGSTVAGTDLAATMTCEMS